MRARMTSRLNVVVAALGLGLGTLGLSACGANDALSAEDARIIEHLASIAPRDAEIDEPSTGVECWKPSESMLDDEQFRVICRVHYEQAGDARYRDVICIGDTGSHPVTEYCYRWAYYTDMPAFEDQRGHTVG